MNARLAVVALALSLVACKTAEPAVHIQYVDRPIVRVEKCVDADDIPARPSELGKRPTRDSRRLADLLLAKAREWEGFGAVTAPLLKGCSG